MKSLPSYIYIPKDCFSYPIRSATGAVTRLPSNVLLSALCKVAQENPAGQRVLREHRIAWANELQTLPERYNQACVLLFQC